MIQEQRGAQCWCTQAEMNVVDVGVFSKSKTAAKLGNLCDLANDALRQVTEEANLHIRQMAEHRWKSFSSASYYRKHFLKNKVFIAIPKDKNETSLWTREKNTQKRWQ